MNLEQAIRWHIIGQRLIDRWSIPGAFAAAYSRLVLLKSTMRRAERTMKLHRIDPLGVSVQWLLVKESNSPSAPTT